MDQEQKKQAQFSGVYLLLAFATLLFGQGLVARRTAPKAVPMSELLQQVRDGRAELESILGQPTGVGLAAARA